MIEIKWKCKCSPNERVIEMEDRASGEDVQDFLRKIQKNIKQVHDALSPECRLHRMEYVKIPFFDNVVGISSPRKEEIRNHEARQPTAFERSVGECQQAHSVKVYFCESKSCLRPHVVLFDEYDTPFAQFVVPDYSDGGFLPNLLDALIKSSHLRSMR